MHILTHSFQKLDFVDVPGWHEPCFLLFTVFQIKHVCAFKKALPWVIVYIVVVVVFINKLFLEILLPLHLVKFSGKEHFADFCCCCSELSWFRNKRL